MNKVVCLLIMLAIVSCVGISAMYSAEKAAREQKKRPLQFAARIDLLLDDNGEFERTEREIERRLSQEYERRQRQQRIKDSCQYSAEGVADFSLDL